MEQQKVCPECKALAALSAVTCGKCGHQYRTKYAEPEKTTVVPAPSPRPSATGSSKREGVLLGYMGHLRTANGTYYAGLLLTNARGIPIEFRHCEGIRPTGLQTVLYGESLEGSLGSDTVAPALYSSLAQKPSILLIDRPGRELFGSFAHANRPSAMLVAGNPSQIPTLDTPTGEGSVVQPIALVCKGSTSSQVFAYIEQENDAAGLAALEAAQHSMNLLSPFDRIRTVLVEIAKVEDGRTRK